MAKKKRKRLVVYSYISLAITLVVFVVLFIDRRGEERQRVIFDRVDTRMPASSSPSASPSGFDNEGGALLFVPDNGSINEATGEGGIILPKDLLEPNL